MTTVVDLRRDLDAPDHALSDWAIELVEALDRLALADGVQESIASLRSHLLGEAPPDELGPLRPVAPAQLEVTQEALQHAFRSTVRVVLEEWLAMTRVAVTAGDVPLDEALATVDALAARLFEFVDRLLAEIAAEQEAEAERLRLSKSDLRRLELRAYLRDESALDEEELAAILSYPVRDAHLAIVLPRARESDARQIAVSLRAVSLAPSFLVHPLGFSTTAIWLSKPLAWTEKSMAAVLRSLAEVGAEASVGTVRDGLGGLKTSLKEAISVEGVRTALGTAAAAVLAYPEVSVEALGLADRDAARRIVNDELGELAAPTESAAQLRATLLAWFGSGSHVSAAARLKLHEHTVRNRLRRAEEIIGRPLMARQAEMQVALRLHRVVGEAEDGTDLPTVPPSIEELAA
jgi:DNA-binding PucR family transcriptional regulator